VKAQVLGTPSHEAAKWREARSRPSEEDRCQRSKRSHELGSSQGESPSIGTQSHEDARSEKEDNRWIQNTGGPLDPHVGSCLGTSRKGLENLATGIARLREVIS
jgi:hypothetical protein